MSIALYLGCKFVDIVKLSLGAKEFIEINARTVAVKISTEIKQKALYIHVARITDGGANADVCDRHILLPVNICLCGIHSVARNYNSLRKAHIYCRRTHLRSEVIACAYNIGERMRMAEVFIGFFHLSGFDELPYKR